jgi:SNF2 family DNA or RNA helicase
VQIIEESWAREALTPPYHIYAKMAYHLSQEARAGLSEFRIPLEFRRKLFEFQSAAARIAAHHLNKRGGVLIGDVVGLGKTLMATALARIVQDDRGISTLILCPKKLVKMWQHHADTYGLQAKIISLSMVAKELPNVPGRFRLIILDESHNLRNREGKRYRAIHEFIQQTDSKCVLLSATPYNKTYLDLANQLRLFVKDDLDLGIRPERLLKDLGETEFIRRHQCPLRSLAKARTSEAQFSGVSEVRTVIPGSAWLIQCELERCLSRSSKATLAPRSKSQTARCTASVDLPTPPLVFASTMFVNSTVA